jgi:uncharacterized protein (TIGR00369 family)
MEGQVSDGEGREVAGVRAWFILLPGRVAAPISWTDPDDGYAPDPGALAGPDAGFGPIGAHLGLTRDGDRLRLRSRPGLCNRLGTLHGGVGALLADLAAGAALRQAGAPRYQPLTTTYSYLRTTGQVGEIVAIEAEVVKPGRAVAMVESRVLTAAGGVALHGVVNADVTAP